MLVPLGLREIKIDRYNVYVYLYKILVRFGLSLGGDGSSSLVRDLSPIVMHYLPATGLLTAMRREHITLLLNPILCPLDTSCVTNMNLLGESLTVMKDITF